MVTFLVAFISIYLEMDGLYSSRGTMSLMENTGGVNRISVLPWIKAIKSILKNIDPDLKRLTIGTLELFGVRTEKGEEYVFDTWLYFFFMIAILVSFLCSIFKNCQNFFTIVSLCFVYHGFIVLGKSSLITNSDFLLLECG